MRKAVNFYRSYYDTAKELPEKERGKFLWAILEKQFENKEPVLEGMAKFAYTSQSYSINAQVAGYVSKCKDLKINPFGIPPGGGDGGGGEPPARQEKVQVQGKEKVQSVVESIDFDGLLNFINTTFERNFQAINKTVRAKYTARLKDGYTKEDFITAMTNCKSNKYHRDTNFQYCTPEFFSRAETLDKYSSTTKQDHVTTYQIPKELN